MSRKAYLITYEVKNKGDDEELKEELQKFTKYWHYIDNSWIILSNKNDANEIYKILDGKFFTENNLLIVEINKNYQGWLPQKAWDWLNNNIEK